MCIRDRLYFPYQCGTSYEDRRNTLGVVMGLRSTRRSPPAGPTTSRKKSRDTSRHGNKRPSTGLVLRYGSSLTSYPSPACVWQSGRVCGLSTHVTCARFKNRLPTRYTGSRVRTYVHIRLFSSCVISCFSMRTNSCRGRDRQLVYL